MSSERARRLDVFVFSTLMNVGMSYLKLLVGRFTSLHVVYQIYCLSFGVLSLAMALQFSLGFKIFQQALMLLSCFGFAVGFFVWCWPYLAKVWKHPIGRAFVITIHVLVLIIATMLSRFIVASSLGLPPQDFDLTVWFIAVLCYIPAWSIVASMLMGSAAILLQLIGLVSVFVSRSHNRALKWFAHMSGALVICYTSAEAFQLVKDNEGALFPLVKWVAFLGDFQATSMYPGFSLGQRIRLHENGIVSIADLQDGVITIEVRKYRE